MNRLRMLRVVSTAMLVLAAPAWLAAQERRPTSSPGERSPGQALGRSLAAAGAGGASAAEVAVLERLARLEAEIRIVREEYDTRLNGLEADLASILTGLTEPVAGGDEAGVERVGSGGPAGVADLPAAGGPDADTAVAPQTTDRARNLRELNPEISVTGDMFGTVSDRSGNEDANQFRIASFEMTLQSDLDPYSQAKAFVVFEDGAFDLEEMYIDWTTLPAGLGLKVGAFRNDFGKTNRWHQHALAQADRPLAHRAFFGEEGLRGLGASLSWLMPASLGDYGEIWLQVTNDDNDVAFSGKGFDDPLFLVHQTNYWDISSAAYFELGFSGATGTNDELGEQRTWVWGTDFNLSWQPPARSLYSGFELRGEVLYQTRDTGLGDEASWGGYTYGTARLGRQWLAGLRADWSDIPIEPGESAWGLSPYVEWWQSEWARLRFQFSHNSRQIEVDEPENRFFFQVTWALGPHKHERY